MRPRWRKGSPRSRNSSSSQPTPTPKMKRPRDTWSTVAAAFAATRALRYGNTITLAPRWMRRVRRARRLHRRERSARDTGVARPHALSFDRGSLRLEAPATARVPPYFVWDGRVGAWRTAAINHLRVREDAAAYRLRLDDSAEHFFP